jgi:adenine-specific DNA methylase
MIINAVYLANWKDLQTRRKIQIHHNNIRENKSHIPHEYKIGDSVYIRKSNNEQKLNPLQRRFVIEKIYTNGTVTIRRLPTVTERINIRRLHPASTRSN